MKTFRNFIPVLDAKVDPVAYGVYPLSIQKIDGGTLFMAKEGVSTLIVGVGGNFGFIGEQFEIEGIPCVASPLSHHNASILRSLCPYTAPMRVLGKEKTLGVGDRLGIATTGHIRAFENSDFYPVFAQQSIRELTLTGRSYEDVLDVVTFAVFKEGYKKGFGADGDHLKKPEEVESALRIGYTMITLDCSEHMHNEYAHMEGALLKEHYVKDALLEEQYLGKTFEIEEGMSLTFDRESFWKMVLVYKDVITFASDIYERYFSFEESTADFEISIDETTTPTTPLEHFFIAHELQKRGVSFATLAPRFCGEFQKGIDYIGDIQQFEQELTWHAAIARYFGYKLSLHSGSDKFSVFPIFGKLTEGRFHVKTAGTNWLEAMKLVAMTDPKLYRDVHAFALSRFKEVTKYYHVSTDISRIPPLSELTDSNLVTLFAHPDARQLIHITYGPILSERDAHGMYLFRDDLYHLWREYAKQYEHLLYKHIGKHMEKLTQHTP